MLRFELIGDELAIGQTSRESLLVTNMNHARENGGCGDPRRIFAWVYIHCLLAVLDEMLERHQC